MARGRSAEIATRKARHRPQRKSAAHDPSRGETARERHPARRSRAAVPVPSRPGPASQRKRAGQTFRAVPLGLRLSEKSKRVTLKGYLVARATCCPGARSAQEADRKSV